jgi:pantetheine-phosphate adenylyltransferase
MKIAIYPGSFDPLSNGHLDIIKRASKLFDKLYILVSLNPKKKYLFTDEERVEIVKKSCESIENVEVIATKKLVLDFARQVNACCIVRGVRNHNDFDSEMQLFQFNHTIDSNIETMLLFPSANNLFLSSSSIKELVMFNSDISPYVPSVVKQQIETILKERLR